MASSGSGYDFSASTFSPDGRIFQVEYASKAVDQSSCIMGVQCTDGVVLACAKTIPHKMVVSSTGSYKRIHHISERAGMTSTGFLPDARVLVARAMDEATDYEEQFGVSVPPKVLSNRLGQYVHYFTLHGALRPFGSSAILGAYNEDTQQAELYMVEPNGTAFGYYGVATGQHKQAAKTELEKLNLHRESVDSKTAVRELTKILLQLHDKETKPVELEMSWLTKENNFQHVGVPKQILQDAKVWAQEQLEEEESDDDEEEEMEE